MQEIYLILVLICIIINEAECLFMCFLTSVHALYICMHFYYFSVILWRNVCLNPLPIFIFLYIFKLFKLIDCAKVFIAASRLSLVAVSAHSLFPCCAGSL